MKLSLEADGEFEVRCESQPAKALDTAREFKPDVTILDLVMLGMDGGEVVVEIKNDPELSGVPVIFVTASITTGAEERNSTLFGYPSLNKPVGLDEVVEAIEKSLDQSGH